jgi:hypothetical protein
MLNWGAVDRILWMGVLWHHATRHSQLTQHARNIPSGVCVATPEDEQVMLETCRGSWFSINWMKSAARWFHYTDMLYFLWFTLQRCTSGNIQSMAKWMVNEIFWTDLGSSDHGLPEITYQCNIPWGIAWKREVLECRMVLNRETQIKKLSYLPWGRYYKLHNHVLNNKVTKPSRPLTKTI